MPLYCASDPTETPWVPSQYMLRVVTWVLLPFHATQSSPVTTDEFWMRTWSTLYVSKPSVFSVGEAVRAKAAKQSV